LREGNALCLLDHGKAERW